MAIEKEIKDDKGRITTYHRIAAYAPVYESGQESLSVNLSGYTSEQYRQNEKTNGQDMKVSSTGISLPLQEDDTYSRAKIYAAIMALPGWEDSVEC